MGLVQPESDFNEALEDVISLIFWCTMTTVTYFDIIYWEKKSEEFFFLTPKLSNM